VIHFRHINYFSLRSLSPTPTLSISMYWHDVGVILKLINIVSEKSCMQITLKLTISCPVVSNSFKRCYFKNKSSATTRIKLLQTNNSVSHSLFTARRVCIARTMPWQDVRPSVHPSVCHTSALCLNDYTNPQSFFTIG